MSQLFNDLGGSLRWYQSEAVKSIFDYYASGKTGNPIIALPTGTGKSFVLTSIQQIALKRWPSQRFLNLTHVKELILQNVKNMLLSWPLAPIGINSAGLKKRETEQPIIFAGIASVARNPYLLGHRDVVIIDECHLVSPKAETMYRAVLSKLKEINPHLRVIGLTATPYRLKQGSLIDSGIFTDICYDMTNTSGFAKLLSEGYLAPIYPKKTNVQLDVSGVGIANGDFKKAALQAAVDKKEVTHKALVELCAAGEDKKSWLIFASGVEHAEHIAELLNGLGVCTVVVHSKLKPNERDKRIAEFKSGKCRCIVNNNILTTGFDHPPIDLIGMFRPTVSTGLWVQMLGRGTRPAESKTDCLVLDYAGNTLRLGPINDPYLPPKKKQNGTPGKAPVRICDDCGTYNHISVKNCICCGNEFPVQEKLSCTASSRELIRLMTTETYSISDIKYCKHIKRTNGNVSLRCDYYCGLQRFSEWVHFERAGFANIKAKKWWHERHEGPVPDTVEKALMYTHEFRKPKRIMVRIGGRYPEILNHEY